MSDELFSMDQLLAMAWCAEECYLQQSGEKSVYHMAVALNYAINMSRGLKQPCASTILTMASIVEPIKNKRGYRKIPVTIADRQIPVVDFDRIIPALCKAWDVMDSARWYKEFESLHPFIDGNGRLGAILYNWHQHSFQSSLVMPPKVF